MEMIIFVGLQASGKSTFFRTHFAATHDYVSKDLLRNNRHPARRQQQLLEGALQAGHSVVVDNTHPTKEEREPLIRLGRLYSATLVGYYFESQVSQCLERNKQRAGKARVPDVAIYATAKKLTRPSYAEGFDLLFEVRITGEGAFEVRDWIEGADRHTIRPLREGDRTAMEPIHRHNRMRTPRLQHVSLGVPHDAQQKVRAFYGGILGLEEKPVPASITHLNLVWFAVGDGEMELHFVPDTIRPNPSEQRHFCLEVDDLDEYRRKVMEAGHEIVDPIPIPNRPRFFCHDPFGNKIELTTILGDYREGV